MAIANTRVFGKHLDRDINDIFFDEYVSAGTEFDKIAKVSTAPPGNHYTEAELSNLGALREIPEGDSVQFDVPVEGHEKTIYYTTHGLGFQITRNMFKDDLTGNFRKMPQKLAKSASMKRETEFFDLFNSGFDTHTSWDGQYVFDTDHATLYSGTTITNDPTAAALSETSLQAAFEYYDALIDEAGFPLNLSPYLLVVPKELRWVAGKLFRNDRVVGGTNWDLNTMNPANNIVDGYATHISKWLTSSTAWFLLAKEHQMNFQWKEKANLESADDFYTGSALFKTTMRFSCFVMDYKGSLGNEGA